EQLCDHVRHHELIKNNEESRILVQNALCYYALPNRQPLINDIQCRVRNEPILVAVGEIELFSLNTTSERWDTLCQAPLEENYPFYLLYCINSDKVTVFKTETEYDGHHDKLHGID
ncbi:unnamed protein product, partial [Rotaria sp. Silwood2]